MRVWVCVWRCGGVCVCVLGGGGVSGSVAKKCQLAIVGSTTDPSVTFNGRRENILRQDQTGFFFYRHKCHETRHGSSRQRPWVVLGATSAPTSKRANVFDWPDKIPPYHGTHQTGFCITPKVARDFPFKSNCKRGANEVSVT